jgi:hypothetical protein
MMQTLEKEKTSAVINSICTSVFITKGVPMISHEHSQMHAEIIASTASAIAIVLLAIAKQVDVAKLREDLTSEINKAASIRGTPPVAIQLATIALGALHDEAEKH